MTYIIYHTLCIYSAVPKFVVFSANTWYTVNLFYQLYDYISNNITFYLGICELEEYHTNRVRTGLLMLILTTAASNKEHRSWVSLSLTGDSHNVCLLVLAGIGSLLIVAVPPLLEGLLGGAFLSMLIFIFMLLVLALVLRFVGVLLLFVDFSRFLGFNLWSLVILIFMLILFVLAVVLGEVDSAWSVPMATNTQCIGAVRALKVN